VSWAQSAAFNKEAGPASLYFQDLFLAAARLLVALSQAV
jgi:hypothetical protein